MSLGKVLAGLSLPRSGQNLWRLAFFLLVLGGCGGCVPWLHIDVIGTEDFDSVRSAIEPDMEDLFEKAEQEFVSGGYWYRYWFDIDTESTEERYDTTSLHIVQFEEDDGSTYEVLFAFTMRGRANGGYYYTPSGKLPPFAPMYGVVCSKHLEGDWYAFNTVDSTNPPEPKNCPEDTQYR